MPFFNRIEIGVLHLTIEKTSSIFTLLVNHSSVLKAAAALKKWAPSFLIIRAAVLLPL